jgi:iron complex outermembrane receptor protein
MENKWGELDGRVWLDYVQARFTNGNNVPRMPPWRIGGSLEYTHGFWQAGLDIFRVADQNQTGNLETVTPGYTMLNLNVVYDIPTDHVDFAIFARGTNLLNEDARRSTSFLKDVAPLPGRAVMVGIRGDF